MDYKAGDKVRMLAQAVGDDLNDEVGSTEVTFPAGSVGEVESVREVAGPQQFVVTVVLKNDRDQVIVSALDAGDIHLIEKI